MGHRSHGSTLSRRQQEGHLVRVMKAGAAEARKTELWSDCSREQEKELSRCTL